MASLIEIFHLFFRLGCTSFGGPAAHIGFFHKTFVDEHRWLSNEQYAAIVALCQFLPGPASSQVGFAIGYHRAGLLGAICAFIAFTAPSIALILVFAMVTPLLAGPIDSAITHGLKVAAIAIVVHAVWGMQKSLTTDTPKRILAILSAVFVMLYGGVSGQLIIIVGGAAIGWLLFKSEPTISKTSQLPASKMVSSLLLAAFAILLAISLLQPDSLNWVSLFGAFYQSGALVFGGGHVALPLLDAAVVSPGWVEPDTFLTGYGAAQAVPGPMFTLATYLGALMPNGYGGVIGALVATFAIFLPGFILILAVLPWWSRLLNYQPLRGAVAGVNAAVVGILAAALYSPIAVNALLSPIDWLLAAFSILLMMRFKLSALWVLGVCVSCHLGIALIVSL